MGPIIIAALAYGAKTVIMEVAKKVPYMDKGTLLSVSKTVSFHAGEAQRRANQVYKQTDDLNEAVSELFGTRNT